MRLPLTVRIAMTPMAIIPAALILTLSRNIFMAERTRPSDRVSRACR
jgi:hypothetical protein